MKILYKIILFITLFSSCQPEMPVTSTIEIDLESPFVVPVNKQLYGITLEEINHAIDGGLYAEMIHNRSFEEGVVPLHCWYDYRRNEIRTPNGWTVPFVRPDSIPGWKSISANTVVWLDTQELINFNNRRSLGVAASGSSISEAGVIALGYQGLSVREGERYELSLYLKGTSVQPKELSIYLADSMSLQPISDTFVASPVYEWNLYKHTFTATQNMDNAVLAITTDESMIFWMDMVSLFPQKTWKERKNGQREDLMQKLEALQPQFIRFPGGSFVEGFTVGTYPIWNETVGDIATRKNLWNVWGYGSTNGMGFYEYLQLCEDLNAEPIYVVNSGITNQSRRPRYENITLMDKLVQQTLDAIAYANEPATADSTLGGLRAKHGHPEPFNLKYVEIGSENYGQDYVRRFDLFQKAINEVYPDITVIKSSPIAGKSRNQWTDYHFYAGNDFLIANYNRYDAEKYRRRFPAIFIGEFSMGDNTLQGTLEAAIGEASFLFGVENNPEVVQRIAYAPILGNVDYKLQRYPAILFNKNQSIGSPSYYLLKMLAENRGDELYRATVNTYNKPQVTFGYAGIDLFDNNYEFEDVRINGQQVEQGIIRSGGWKIENGKVIADANRWNNILFGDEQEHDYTFSMKIRRTKGSSPVQLRVRDNGKEGEANDHIALSITPHGCEFYRSAGSVKDSLRSPKPFEFESRRWYDVSIVCKDEKVSCYIDGTPFYDVTLPSYPSLMTVSTVEKETNTLILKVVNHTHHEEKTALHINGANIDSEATVIQLTGNLSDYNSFEHPSRIVPQIKQHSFNLSGEPVYTFPKKSITILRLKMDK